MAILQVALGSKAEEAVAAAASRWAAVWEAVPVVGPVAV